MLRLLLCLQSLQAESPCSSQSMININQQLQRIFDVAIRASFPDMENPPVALAPNQQAKFGDYQCNSAMAMAQVRAPPTGDPVRCWITSQDVCMCVYINRDVLTLHTSCL